MVRGAALWSPRRTCGLLMDETPPALPIVAPQRAVAGVDPDRAQMDYLLLAILIRIQHLMYAEARVLVDAALQLDQRSTEVLMAKAVVENALGNHAEVLATLTRLDRIDPPQFRKGKKADPRVRVRSFLQARAGFALNGTLDAEGRAALDFYLRQGREDGAGATE